MNSRQALRFAACLAFWFAANPVLAQDSPLARGVVIPSVACAGKPGQSYALYLPSNFTPDRAWPVIFAFDPDARGRRPVELLRELAEEYGYVVAGSNNSRNGPYQLQIEAADAMLQDATRRFPLDARRAYATGFSGGARAALMVASLCNNCIAGVIAHGAGFPEKRAPTEKPSFVFFAAVGDLDFNYPELVELEPQLDALGVPNRLRRFPGPHGWAPPEVWREAVEWLELLAMKQGRRPKDATFVTRRLDRATQKVLEMEKSGDLFAAWQEHRKLAADFDGLADTSLFARRATELRDSPAVREGTKRERAAMDEQRRLVEPFLAPLNALSSDATARAQVRTLLSDLISAMLDRIKRNPEGDKAKVLRRAQVQLFAYAFEAGEERLRTKNTPSAMACFEIAAEIAPDSAWPLLELALLHAQAGRRKDTLRALQQARARGLSAEKLTAFLGDNPAFASYRDRPEFRRLLLSPNAPR